MNIRTVNLVWEKRVRGSYAVSPYAVTNEGVAARALPRPLEPRTADLVHIQPDGSIETRIGFSVETLIKLDLTVRADSFLGLTADDLYLFHEGKKERFLHDKRILYSDAALSGDGKSLFCGFSDMAGGSHAVAFGEVNGHLAWVRDVDSASVTSVTISGDGSHAAYGTDTGFVVLLSSHMKEIWSFEVEDHLISALASSGNGDKIAYGTQSGEAGVINETGGRLWSLNLEHPVTALALNGDGSLCAVVIQIPANEETPERSRLVLVTAMGRIGWEYLSEKPISRIALSPGSPLSDRSAYLVVSGKDNTTSLFLIEESTWLGLNDTVQDNTARRDTQIGLYESLVAEGKEVLAVSLLQAQAMSERTNLELARRAYAARQTLLARLYAETETALEEEDTLKAMMKVEEALKFSPYEVETCVLRQRVISARVVQLEAASEEGHLAEPNLLLREALDLDPYNFPLRERYTAALLEKAAVLDAKAEGLIAQGDLSQGVEALEQAQHFYPTPERAAKIERARTAQEFSLGLEYYSAKDYTQAIFQFRKVLGRDPNHAEAKRNLQFAQKFQQDAAADNSLNSRFSMLE